MVFGNDPGLYKAEHKELSLSHLIVCLGLALIYQSAAHAQGVDTSSHGIARHAANQIQQLYPLIEPRLGVRLTDPNVVLTLGGARGHAEVVIYRPKPGDIQAFEALNSIAQPSGIRFKASAGTSARGEPCLNVDLDNLQGYELVSSQTKLPGVPRFYAKDGWEGLRKWYEATGKGLKQAQNNGLLPRSDLSSDSDILTGLGYGYPDEALLGVIRVGYHAADTSVPFANYYDGSTPGYAYDPKDIAAVTKHSSYWGEILRSYFTSSQHRAMESDPIFAQHRAEYTGPERYRPALGQSTSQCPEQPPVCKPKRDANQRASNSGSPANDAAVNQQKLGIKEIGSSRTHWFRPFVPSIDNFYRDSVHKPPEGWWWLDRTHPHLDFEFAYDYMCFNYVYEQVMGVKSNRYIPYKELCDAVAGLGYTPVTFQSASTLPSSFPPGTVIFFDAFHVGLIGDDGTAIFSYWARGNEAGLPTPAMIQRNHSAREISYKWRNDPETLHPIQPYAHLQVTIWIPPGKYKKWHSHIFQEENSSAPGR